MCSSIYSIPSARSSISSWKPATRAKTGRTRDLMREGIDLPVLQSGFLDFEDLLLNDGCAGAAIICTTEPMEVQFDEHKLLIVYAHDLEPFERVLIHHGVLRDDDLKLITEGEHLHSTAPRYADEFERLCCRVGVGEPGERVSLE